MGKRRWRTVWKGATYHVTPIRDLRPHTRTLTCACKPEILRRGLPPGVRGVVHQSHDGRELIERWGIQ